MVATMRGTVPWISTDVTIHGLRRCKLNTGVNAIIDHNFTLKHSLYISP